MLYKLVFLALLLIVNVHNIAADNTRQLLQATPTTTDDDGTEANLPDDGTDDGNDDGNDDDGNDGTDLDDLNDDIENTEGPDSMDENYTTEDGSIDESGDSTGSPSSDVESESVPGSASSSGDPSESVESVDSSADVDSESEEDICGGLVEYDCLDLSDDDGDAECAFNAVQNDCYSIERRDGRHGSGNFDDGYNTAKQQAVVESNQLTTLIGVLGGIIGALVLIISGGGYYFYKTKGNSTMGMDDMGQTSTIDEYYDEQPMVISTGTIENVSPVMTKGNDSDPMLS